MLFTSYAFLGFIALLFLLYYLIPRRMQWGLLLFASYLFYFIAGPSWLLYILTTTVTTYFAALRIEETGQRQKAYIKANKEQLSGEEKKAYKEKMKGRQRTWMLVCLLLNLGILAVVKYTNFAISNINGLLRVAGSATQLDFWDIALPMGISFYTFQALGYLIDVYRGTVAAEKNPFRLALFVSFFPQLIQGPISRFGDLAQSLYEEHAFEAKRFCYGLERILWGYFKKLVIADRILTGVNTIIRDAGTYRGAYVFVGMLFYALELYADFTGGIDITIGIAQALGITVKENFNRPYFSKSVKEYWRRWHITMGTWFTDYIFYPISVCKPMLKLSRFARARLGENIGKRVPIYLSSFAVWFATGIWHGASWNFIVWGLGNWVVLMISQELEPLYARFHRRFDVQGRGWFKLFQVLRTILIMSCLRTFDCYRNVPLTFQMFGTLFTEWNWHILWDGSLLALGLSVVDYGILLAGLMLLVAVSLLQRKGSVRDSIAARPYPVRFLIWYGLFLIVLLAGAYGIGYDASQFIYNQF
ncbi:MAG: MBOAT family protein [Lachnospiraceae bacterium]|nr:MBOAT family protein [Lachnospiraceae bacterium]